MTQDPEISIIIPIYKVEKFLEQCLDSVKNQTFTNFEAILIDDKSPDNSLTIAKKFVAEDSRFILLEQSENKGYGAAMNLGISKVRSPYMTFLESDDFLAENALEILYNAMQKEKVDLVFSVPIFSNFLPNSNTFEPLFWTEPKLENAVIHPRQQLELFFARTEPWGVLYDVNFWKTYDLHFLEDKIENRWLMYQDLVITVQVRLMAKRVCIINEHLYYYRLHGENSVTLESKVKNNIFFPFLFEKIDALIPKNNADLIAVKHRRFHDILVQDFIFLSEPIKEKLRKICSQDLPLENPYLTAAQNQRYIHFIQGKMQDLRSPLEQIIRSKFFRPVFFWVKWLFYRLPLSIRRILKK